MFLMHRKLSDRQVEANRANAQKSPSARTLAGKVPVSLNSLQHGIYPKRWREIRLKRDRETGEGEGIDAVELI